MEKEKISLKDFLKKYTAISNNLLTNIINFMNCVRMIDMA